MKSRREVSDTKKKQITDMIAGHYGRLPQKGDSGPPPLVAHRPILGTSSGPKDASSKIVDVFPNPPPPLNTTPGVFHFRPKEEGVAEATPDVPSERASKRFAHDPARLHGSRPAVTVQRADTGEDMEVFPAK